MNPSIWMDTQLQQAVAHGFAPIPMHGVVFAPGEPTFYACTCGRLDCPSPGKHPRIAGWNHLRLPTMDRVASWLALFRESPDNPLNWAYHLGLSRKVGLDIDDRNGGLEQW